MKPQKVKAMPVMSKGGYRPPTAPGVPRMNLPKPGRVGKLMPSPINVVARKPPSKRARGA